MSVNNTKDIPKLDELITKDKTSNLDDIDKITDKIYLGGDEGALKIENFQAEKINNVLSITDSPPKYQEELKINHKTINLKDCLSVNIIPFLKECIYFIEYSDKIYVHCSCGISRSPSIVIAYLIWKTHSNFLQVYNFVLKRRPCIEPSICFIRQLKKFEAHLKTNNYNYKEIDYNCIK